MKKFAFITFLSLISLHIIGQIEHPQSPYFMVTSESTAVDALPLKSTKVKVDISGVIADVIIEQTYANLGNSPIEAVYVFPGSTSSAVYSMQMQIGKRILDAKIEEKGKARAIYTKAKENGNRTSLLEQHRPNVFQMNVANIMPGDTIKVRLGYTELLVPESGTYEFVYPTVVGPRYINGNEKSNVAYAGMPYQHSGNDPLSSFDMSISLSAGMPIAFIQSTTHPVDISAPNAKEAIITLQQDPKNGNRDFVLQYNLQGNSIESGILLYEKGNEKYFLCVVQPPKRLETNAIPPREYIFVVDVSGSMHGFPLDVSKKLLTDLILGLRPTDLFNVILFAGSNSLMAESSLPATPENIQQAIAHISKQQGGGGTELLSALQRSLTLPQNLEGISRSIVVVTDGYIGVEPEAFELIRQNLNKANLFAFGIGSSVNRHLIEGLAYAGQGVPAVILNQEEAPAAAAKFRQYIANPVFTQIKSTFSGFEAYDIEPVSIPDVLAERPIVLFGKYRGKAQGHIFLTGYTGQAPSDAIPSLEKFGFPPPAGQPGKQLTIDIAVDEAKPDTSHAALKYLWARTRLRRIADFTQSYVTAEQVKEITKLGLEYNLLTAYTSFVAVERRSANDEPDSSHTVLQPLPMPEGVSDHAVGFELNITGFSGTMKTSMLNLYLLCIITLAGMVLLFTMKRKKRIFSILLPITCVAAMTSCGDPDLAKIESSSVSRECVESVTFILGADTSPENMYYHQATQYYKQCNPDGTHVVVEHIRSLDEMVKYLQTKNPAYTPWKTINLVVHGNPWTGMALPIDENGKDRTNAASLEKARSAGLFKPFSSAIINCDTRVHLLGCGIGSDKDLVNQFGHLFTNTLGEEAMIFASEGFNVFHTSDGHDGKIEKYIASWYFVAYPIDKKPTPEELAVALAGKYPQVCMNWMEALQRRDSGPGYKPYNYNLYIPVRWTFLLEDKESMPTFKWQDQIMHWVGKKEEVMATLTEMEFRPDHFWWTVKPATYKINPFQHQPSLELKGSTRIYCVLVPEPDPTSKSV